MVMLLQGWGFFYGHAYQLERKLHGEEERNGEVQGKKRQQTQVKTLRGYKTAKSGIYNV